MKPFTNQEISGNWATLLLATDSDGNIDFSKMNDEIDVLISSRPNGIYSNGTAGQFMKRFIEPLITVHHYSNQACDRFMAVVGGWADVGPKLRWPYKSVPEELAEPIRKQAKQIIPEFFEKQYE